MIRELKNPMCPEYLQLKEIILSGYFSWSWGQSTRFGVEDYPFLSHCFIRRPGEMGFLYPMPSCELAPKCNYVVGQINDSNDLGINCILRVNANLTFPWKDGRKTPIHTDHEFPHKNILIYLNDSDGDTVCGNDRFTPKEDAIILFEGDHYHYLPSEDKRVVLVVTYI